MRQVSLATPRGWQASLELAFERRCATTVLVRNAHEGPLQVQKALYPEARDTCHAAVLHPPGGVASTDTLRIEALLQVDSRVLLTTPGATKWYRSDGHAARQELHFVIQDRAVLEWLPRENILFDGSNICTSLDVVLSAGSRYFGWEILSFGRRASGERWGRGRLSMRTSICRAGRSLWTEKADVDASTGFAQSNVGLSGFTVCGTFVVAGYDIDDELLLACRRVTLDPVPARVGVTRVPAVLIARYLGNSTEVGFKWFTDLWALIRPTLTARAACMPRLWAC